MKKVLVVHYSQSGQLNRIVDQFTAPLVASDEIELVFENLCPVEQYPFPWPFLRFIDTFPEAVYLDPPPIKPLSIKKDDHFDLVIIAYQVWFLSPSLPTTAFMQSEEAAGILKDTPVVTLIACRNMWLMAQEQMKSMLANLGAKLVGNVALVDEAGSIASFLATPIWVLSGNKGPYLGGLIPKAGVSEENINACSRFGHRLLERMEGSEASELDESLLSGLNAVTIDEGLISSEQAGKRAFRLWGALFRALGPQGSWRRKPLILIYTVFLLLLIMTVVPLGILLKKLLKPFTREKVEAQKAYYGGPSGSG